MAYQNGPKIITDGLVLCLDAGNPKSYPGSGTSWVDLSRNGNDLTLQNGPTFSSGNGGAIFFDGTNDCASKTSINVSYLTIDVWARWTQFFSDFDGHALISNSDTDSGDPINGYLLYQATDAPYNKVKAFVYGSSLAVLTSVSTLSTGVWYNITFTYNGSATRLYLNGVLNNSVAATVGAIAASSANFIVGATYTVGSDPFNGNLANVKLYNRALSASEILQNYNATKGRFKL
jgi:hypothetical protein